MSKTRVLCEIFNEHLSSISDEAHSGLNFGKMSIITADSDTEETPQAIPG